MIPHLLRRCIWFWAAQKCFILLPALTLGYFFSLQNNDTRPKGYYMWTGRGVRERSSNVKSISQCLPACLGTIIEGNHPQIASAVDCSEPLAAGLRSLIRSTGGDLRQCFVRPVASPLLVPGFRLSEPLRLYSTLFTCKLDFQRFFFSYVANSFFSKESSVCLRIFKCPV